MTGPVPFGVWPECLHCGSHDWGMLAAGATHPTNHASAIRCTGCGTEYVVRLLMSPVHRGKRGPQIPARLTNGKDPQ